MSVGIEKKRITAEELARLPTGMGVRYELNNGELIEMSPAGIKHGVVAALVIHYFLGFVLKNGNGKITTSETGFWITRNPDTVKAPDMAFIPQERIPVEGVPNGYGEFVPAIVVEVASPYDTASEIEDKTQGWLHFGVSEVWNIYPNGERVLVHPQDGQAKLYQGDETISGGSILPGFKLALKDIFQV